MRKLVIDAPAGTPGEPFWVYDVGDGTVTPTDCDVYGMVGRRELDEIAGRRVSDVWPLAADLAMRHGLTRKQAVALAVDTLPGPPAYRHFGVNDGDYYIPLAAAKRKAAEPVSDDFEGIVAMLDVPEVGGVPTEAIRDRAASWIMTHALTRKQAVYLAVDTMCDGDAHVIMGVPKGAVSSAVAWAAKKLI